MKTTQTAKLQELERLAKMTASVAEAAQRNLRRARIEAMTRGEMLVFAQKTAANLEQGNKWAVEEGIIEAGDYTWQDELFENSSVDINTMEDLEQLTDEDLKKIVDAYYL